MSKVPTPPTVVAVYRKDLNALRRVLLEGASVDATDVGRRTALHYAASDGLADMAAVLIAAGASVGATDRHGMTPLHLAAINSSVEVASQLLAAGAPVNSQEEEHGSTPLWRAVFASCGRGEMITLLRKYGADPDIKNRHGISARTLAETISNYDVKQWM